MAGPSGLSDIIHSGPNEATRDKIICGHDIPRIFRVITADVALSPTIVRQLLRHEETTFGKLLVVGKHTRFQIIISYHIRHP